MQCSPGIQIAIAGFRAEISDTRDVRGTEATETSRRIYDLVFAEIRRKLGDVRGDDIRKHIRINGQSSEIGGVG